MEGSDSSSRVRRPFAFASGPAYAVARDATRSPAFRPIRFPPCRGLGPRRGLGALALSSAACCLPALTRRRPSVWHRNEALSLHPRGLRPGRRAVYASQPLSRVAVQDSLRRGWL